MGPQHSWLGVGNMGSAMGKQLAQRGKLDKPLILWSRTFDHALALHRNEPNTLVADSLDTAVAHGDIVWSCMLDDEVVLSLYRRILDGRCGGHLAGKLFVECGTMRPATANRIAAELDARGAGFVAMPTLGDSGMARSGVLTVMPAGERAAVDRLKPYLHRVLAHSVLDYGGHEPGKGPLMKIVGNVALVNITESLAESHVMADKTGLGTEMLEEFLETVLPGPHLLYSRRFHTGAYYKAKSVINIEVARRVAALALELAGATGTAVPAYEVSCRLMDEVAREPDVSPDVGGVYGALRRASGLPWGNKDW